MKLIAKKLILAISLYAPVSVFSYVGGQLAPKGAFPFTVAFPELHCTGAKIGPKRFITAAHCLANRGPFPIYKAGDAIEILGQGKDGKLYVEHSSVSKVTIHSSYMNKIAENNDPNKTVIDPSVIDMAIIDISDNTKIPTGELNPVSLKRNDQIIVGGFGCENPDEDIEGRFRHHEVIYKTAGKKVAEIQKYTANALNLDSNGKSHSTGCGGDSGGPVYQLNKGKLSIVGINSYVDARDSLNFVRISILEILKWIKSI